MRRVALLAGFALLLSACAGEAKTSTSSALTASVPSTTAGATTTSTVPAGPPSYLIYGWEGIRRVEGGVATSLTIEPVRQVWDDGAGGVVYRTVTQEPGVVWLPAGADRPVVVDMGDEGWPGVMLAGLIEGRPSVVVNRGWDGMVQCERADYVDEVLVLDLETGTERFVMCRPEGPDGGWTWTSSGGGLFSLVGWAAVGASSSNLGIEFRDLHGREVTVEHNPFAESCAPCELDVKLSPDGSRLAYAYWPTSSIVREEPPDGDYTRVLDEWWEASRDIPTQLVVLDLETGEERWRTEAPAQTPLAEFDGRYLTIGTDTSRTIHDTVTGEVYPVPPARIELTDFWVAILESLDTATHSYASTQRVAADIAEEHGVETGVLWSEGWVTLNSGYWVVFTGGYPTREEATSTCEELRPRLTSCYPRYAATPETIDPTIGLGMLELREDGLGLFEFGDPVDEVMKVLTRVLGAPDQDFVEDPEAEGHAMPYGYATSTYFRHSRWDAIGLAVVFSDHDYFRTDGSPHLVAWGVDAPGLATRQGTGIGSTVADLQGAYGDDLELTPEYTPECGQGWSFRIGPLLSHERLEQGFDRMGEWFWYTINGQLDSDPANPESRVTFMHAGASSTC